MTKLEELLKEYCPEGVEYKTLGEVCEVSKGQQLNKSVMLDVGSYPVINGGINPSGYVEKFNCAGNIITVSQGGASAGYVNWMKVKFWAGAHCYVIKVNDDVENRYVYHFLKLNEKKLMECQYGAGIPALAKNTILNLSIPLPPLAAQREIVRILDNFTLLSENLAENLAEELAARLQQYEYYRDELLTFGDEVPRMKVSEICHTFIGLVTTMTKHYVNDGVVLIHNSDIKENSIQIKNPVYLDEKFAKQNENRKHRVGDIITVHTGDVGTSAIIDESLDGSIGFATIVSRVIDKNMVNNKFVCHYFNSTMNKKNIIKVIKGDRDNLNLKDHNSLEIPVPPLAEQERIVKILDKFDALCHDLTAGLPAEIEARRQQYEYYRDKLLTFEEKKKDV